jgi:hypothetical protein
MPQFVFRFSAEKPTFAVSASNDDVAPIPVVRRLPIARPKSNLTVRWRISAIM